MTQTIPSKQLIHLQMKRVTVFLKKSLNHSLKRFFKTADSSTNEASDCVFEEIIESFTQTILQNSWFIYKWSKWLCFWINHWIIHSNNSSKQLIHLQMKQVTVFLNKSLNHSLKRFLQNSWFIYKWSKSLSQWAIHWIIHSNDSFKTADSFTNEASDCVFEEIIESFTQMIHSKQLIHLQMKQVPVSMSNSLNHSLKWFIQNSWFIYKWSKWLCFWRNHWIIHSNDSFKTADSFTNEASPCLNEQFIESFTQMIHSKQLIHLQMKQVPVSMSNSLNHSLKWFIQNSWFIYKWSKSLSQWAIHWIIHSNDSFKTADSFTNEASDCVFEEIIESFTQMIHSKQLIHLQMKQVPVSTSNSLNHSLKWFIQNSWFIYKWSKSLSQWAIHWIIHSNDSFKTADSFTNEASPCLNEQFIESFTQMIHSKQLIHLQMKQVPVSMSNSLNHSLKWFIQNSWFIYKWSKSLSQWAIHWIIHSNDSFKTADSFTNEASDCVFE